METNRIIISSGINLQSDKPLDARDRISSISDISNIINPDVGGIFYCEDTKSYYTIVSLTDTEKHIAEYELIKSDGATSITINNEKISVTPGSQEIKIPDDFKIISESKNLRNLSEYNITLEMNDKRYNSVEEALSDIKILEGISSIPDGFIIKYMDLYFKWRTYIYTNNSFLTFDEYSEYDYSQSKTLTGTFITSSGQWKTSPETKTYSTVYIRLFPSDWIYSKAAVSGNNSTYIINFFDKDYNFISGIGGNPEIETIVPVEVLIGPNVIPRNTEYVVFNNVNATLPNPEYKIWTYSSKNTISSEIVELTEDIENLYNMVGHREIASWKKDSLDPNVWDIEGQRKICNKESIFLVTSEDTDNDGIREKIKIIGELQKNNLFKFTDGTYAPVVVISDSDYDATNGIDLYTNPTHTSLAYSAGTFDPIDWWVTKCKKKEQPLYNSSGLSVYVRKPWETKDSIPGNDIVIGWKDPFWMIPGEKDSSGNMVYGFFEKETYYNGILAQKVEPTGYFLDLATAGKQLFSNSTVEVIGDGWFKPRCLYFKTTDLPSSLVTNPTGANGYIKYPRKDRPYPFDFTDQTDWKNTPFLCATKCLDNNFNFDKGIGLGKLSTSRVIEIANSKNCKYKPGMCFHRMSHIYSRFIKYKTYYLHSDSLWGPGISINIAPTEDTFSLCKGGSGVVWSVDGGPSRYQYFQLHPDNIRPFANSDTNFLWTWWLNVSRSFCRPLEAQMALSWVNECDIQPEVSFIFDGDEYKYSVIPGVPGPLDNGYPMNARLFKWTTLPSFMPYKPNSSEKCTVQAKVKVQFPVCDGMILWGQSGDIDGYSGFNIVLEKPTEDTGMRTLKTYLCTSYKDLIMESPFRSDDNPFEFENRYKKVGIDFYSGLYNWATECIPGSPLILPGKSGGTVGTGQCSFSTLSPRSSYSGKKYYMNIYSTSAADWSTARSVLSYVPLSNINNDYEKQMIGRNPVFQVSLEND